MRAPSEICRWVDASGLRPRSASIGAQRRGATGVVVARPRPLGNVPACHPFASNRSVPMDFRINGRAVTVDVDVRTSLLDLLRDHLGLTGAKKGCNQGACGACTVLVEGERINACLALAVQYQGCSITTIEGLGTEDALHPLQRAFIEHDGFQCGYCTPGQICSAIAMAGEIARG